MKSIIPTAFLSIMLFSCATINYQEIVNKEDLDFETLQLKPDVEPNGLRIDIIRNNKNVYYADSLIMTELAPYHPLGFDLGNGLFYDLGGNLSFRVDYLLNFNQDTSFNLASTGKRTGNRLIQFKNDSLSYSHPPKKKIRWIYHRSIEGDSAIYNVKKSRDFIIVNSDSSLVYRGKRKIWDGIYQIEKDRFALYRKEKRSSFSRTDQELVLNRSLQIRMTPGRDKIEVYKYKRKRMAINPLFTIQRSQKTIFVYNSSKRGIKITLEENRLDVSNGRKILKSYSLLENGKE